MTRKKVIFLNAPLLLNRPILNILLLHILKYWQPLFLSMYMLLINFLINFKGTAHCNSNLFF